MSSNLRRAEGYFVGAVLTAIRRSKIFAAEAAPTLGSYAVIVALISFPTSPLKAQTSTETKTGKSGDPMIHTFLAKEADDSIPKVIVNETLVRELGIEDPIGERVTLDTDGNIVDIIGVVKDFHFDSMHDEIQAVMLHIFNYNSIWYLFVKAEEDQMAAVLEHCEKVWKEVVPEFSWDYTFMSEILEGQYKDEDRWSRVIAYAAAIAILLSCLGLMGISGLLVARRYQEVGIRKANGASIGKIIMLLNRELLKWVLLAYILACPVAWLAMRRWLQDFAFRTEISWWIFALAGMAAIFISIFTITLQIYRVARQNPVNALRYE